MAWRRKRQIYQGLGMFEPGVSAALKVIDVFMGASRKPRTAR
jgi:hypothetical protein